jgi:hypothetical protein
MPARSSGDDDHVVSESGFSGNIDGDDIFCFGVLEAREDLIEGMGGGIIATFQALRNDGGRPSLGVYCCQGRSFRPVTATSSSRESRLMTGRMTKVALNALSFK